MKKLTKTLVPPVFFLLFFSFVPAREPYRLPPKDVVKIVDAPPPPRAFISNRGKYLLLADYTNMPSIEYLAQPMHRIAGLRMLPGNSSRQQTSFFIAFRIIDIATGKIVEIELPDGARCGYPVWSNDDRWIAFSRYTNAAVQLWLVSSEDWKAGQVKGIQLNTVFSRGFQFVPDNEHLLVMAVDENRGPAPGKPLVPVGPVIQETSGKVSKVRTYQDLLKNSHDEALFEYYAKSQLLKINLNSGKVTAMNKPALYLEPDYSPDGGYLLVHRLHRPFSYSVPWYRFPMSIEVWDAIGTPVKRVADKPLAEEVPIGGVVTGPRDVEWNRHAGHELLWVEALDGGDPEAEVPHRDRIMRMALESEQPAEVFLLKHRYRGIDWLQKKNNVLITEYDWKKRWRTTYRLDLTDPQESDRIVFDMSRNDRYNDPGRPVYFRNRKGVAFARMKEDAVYFSGRGASPQGDFPFLQLFDLQSKKGEKIFFSATDRYEYFEDFAFENTEKMIIRSESPTDPPNYYLVNQATGKRRKLSNYKDPAPQLRGIHKQILTYKRKDGVGLSGTLYLPAGYKKGTRLPLMLWAYPREYSDAKVASQIRGSANRFTRLSGYSHLFFLTQGYAVLDGAQMPVIGDPKTMNDTFVEQIVSSAQAAIDTLDRMGVIDPDRVGVGGHSYGAFMTANLLAHCDLFAAGIARSGAYNRTLTPFGFQSERRTLWQALEAYFRVSPFMHADQINEPLLLIHGEADNNSGTFPLQSRRMFHALKGHGATTRLVMLPYESHGYRARESVLHVLAEMFEWFDKYVKNAR